MPTPLLLAELSHFWLKLCHSNRYYQGGYSPGKVREFHIRQGKVMEIVVCLFCATTVLTVTK